jgi:hypothetical protein
MTFEPAPRIGDWYKNASGDAFEVVAHDDDDDTLELQYYDGTVEQLDAESWGYLRPLQIDPPEDWNGSLDVAPEDSQRPEFWVETDDWMQQLDHLDREPG